MRAVETNPSATSTPQGTTVQPYRSGYRNGQPIMYNGRPISEIFEEVTPDLGPHSNYRIAQKALQSAANSHEVMPQIITRHGVETPSLTFAMLDDGLNVLGKLYRGEPLKVKTVDIGPAPVVEQPKSVFSDAQAAKKAAFEDMRASGMPIYRDIRYFPAERVPDAGSSLF